VSGNYELLHETLELYGLERQEDLAPEASPWRLVVDSLYIDRDPPRSRSSRSASASA